jgi:soluble lytic murein transglycosylase
MYIIEGLKKRIGQIAGGALVITLVLLYTVPALAEVYFYRDKDGVMHFTNAPASQKYKPYFKEAYKYRVPAFTADTNPAQYRRFINEAAHRHGISTALLKAIIKVESDYNPKAVSRKGAKGLMQIMPENFTVCNIDNPFDPRQNIMGGTRFLKRLIERFDGDLTKAVAAYNAGAGAVERCNGIPPFEETRSYVSKVLKLYRRYNR